MLKLLLPLVFLLLFMEIRKQESTIAFPLNFKLQVLTSKGEVTQLVKKSDYFVLCFSIINPTANVYYLTGMNTENFLTVYNANGIAVGKPWKSIFCQYTNGVAIAANDTTRFEIPYQPDVSKTYPPFCVIHQNASLSPGNYRTAFSSSFEITRGLQTLDSPILNFNTLFIVTK